MAESTLINATGLWANKTKNGDTYLAGNLGGVRVMIFKNDKKGNDKAPDYRMVFGENKPKEERETPESRMDRAVKTVDGGIRGGVKVEVPDTPYPGDDDLPF